MWGESLHQRKDENIMADIAPGFPFEMLPTYPISKCVTIHWTTWNGGMQLCVCVCMSLPVLCLPTLNDPLFSTTPASTFCAHCCVLCNLYQLVIQSSLEVTPCVPFAQEHSPSSLLCYSDFHWVDWKIQYDGKSKTSAKLHNVWVRSLLHGSLGNFKKRLSKAIVGMPSVLNMVFVICPQSRQDVLNFQLSPLEVYYIFNIWPHKRLCCSYYILCGNGLVVWIKQADVNDVH